MKYIVILRGINVGGHRKILMADLKKHLINLNLENITTYIQSGNILFDYFGKIEPKNLEEQIETLIKTIYGFDVPTIILTKDELDNAIRFNPYFQDLSADTDRLHLTFLKNIPTSIDLEKTSTFDYSPDLFTISGKNIFIYCAKKYSDTKLTNSFFESKLKVSTTTRNWKTVLKLSELVKS